MANKHSSWCYFKEMKRILVDVGLDHAILSNVHDLPGKFSEFSMELYQNNFKNDLNKFSSLSLYMNIKKSTFPEEYLFNIADFEGSRLKFKTRTGWLELEDNLCKWVISDGICKLCNHNREDIGHFLFSCNATRSERVIFFNKLEVDLETSHPGLWLRFISSSVESKLCILLGNSLMDSACKAFLKNLWNQRRKLQQF